MRQSTDMIMAAFCYVEAVMIWKIGEVAVYYGYAPMWFVILIATLFAVSGASFQFESVLNEDVKTNETRRRRRIF